MAFWSALPPSQVLYSNLEVQITPHLYLILVLLTGRHQHRLSLTCIGSTAISRGPPSQPKPWETFAEIIN